MPILDRPLLIVAASRSGTKYAAEYFRAVYGLDIGHERVAADGMIGWTALTNTRWPSGSGPSVGRERKWGCVLYQVRNPLLTIASMTTHEQRMRRFIREDCIAAGADMPPLKPRLPFLMAYWLQWHRRAVDMAEFAYRVEDLYVGGEADRLIARRLDLAPQSPDAIPPNNCNTRRHDILTWSDLANADAELAGRVLSIVQGYGYV